jgi:PAS domain S-box-containing protein
MDSGSIDTLGSETAFKVLFQYATIGILVVDSRGTIVLANPSALDLFGYSEVELVGKPMELLIPEELKTKHVAHREKYFVNPKPRPMGKGSDLFALRRNGEVLPVEISLSHYKLSGEKMAVAFITDITGRKQAEKKMKQLNEELEQRVEARTQELQKALERQKELSEMKSRFVSMASHEFRTPLSTILSSVSLIEQYTREADGEKRKKHIDRIKSSVKNLTDILNDFLSLEKLEQSKVDLETEEIEMTSFLKDVMEEVQNHVRRGQTINYSHQGDKTIVHDRKILRNILLNLLSNASKYSTEGQEIKLRSEVTPNEVLITVQDFGIGIPEEEQPNLFGKFYRAKNALNIQGTGLGLSIVKRYVELMNGSISFQSQTGTGTTFYLTFPKTANHEKDSAN